MIHAAYCMIKYWILVRRGYILTNNDRPIQSNRLLPLDTREKQFRSDRTRKTARLLLDLRPPYTRRRCKGESISE